MIKQNNFICYRTTIKGDKIIDIRGYFSYDIVKSRKGSLLLILQKTINGPKEVIKMVEKCRTNLPEVKKI